MTLLLILWAILFADSRARQVLAIAEYGLRDCLDRLIDPASGQFRNLAPAQLRQIAARARNADATLSHAVWLKARAALGLVDVVWQPTRLFEPDARRTPDPAALVARVRAGLERLARADALASRLAARLARAQSARAAASLSNTPAAVFLAHRPQLHLLQTCGADRTSCSVGAVFAALPRPG